MRYVVKDLEDDMYIEGAVETVDNIKDGTYFTDCIDEAYMFVSEVEVEIYLSKHNYNKLYTLVPVYNVEER